MAELENCEHIETVYLTPDAAQWDPYDEEYAAAEDRFLDFRGDLIHRPPKRRKILDDADVFELQVSEEQYEADISSIVGENETGAFKLGDDDDPSSVINEYFDFVRDEDYMQAAVADLTGCFDEELLRRAVTERTAKSKIAMESGNITLEGFKDNEDDSIFELAAAHAETPKGVTAEHLSKVWRISDEVAQRTLDFSKKAINKRGCSMMQLFVSNKGFVKVYDVKSEKELINTLKLFCKEVWAPKAFMVNGARTEKSNKVRQFLNKVGTTLRVLEGETMAKVYVGPLMLMVMSLGTWTKPQA